MSIVLYPDQRAVADEALFRLQVYHIVYLAMEMRTGKTPTSLTIAKEYGAKTVLFVSKLKAIADIRKSKVADHFPELSIEFINYQSAHKIENKNPDIVICDESHYLGGYGDTQKRKGKFNAQYQALIDVARNKPIIYLTGTPSPESYVQLYFQFYLSSYSPFSPYTSFYKWAKDYVNINEKRIGGRTIRSYDNGKAIIYDDVKHLFVSLKQSFDNSVHDIILPVYPSENIMSLYEKMESDGVITIEGIDIIADSPASLQSKLQQIIAGHIIDTETGMTFILSSHKAQAILGLKEKKIAVFYRYKADRAILLSVLKNVTESVDEFQKGDFKYFIGQIQSIKEGVNLDVAEAIAIVTQEFSSSSYIQCRARLQSRDKVGEYPIYFLQCPGTVDEYVYECVSKKKRYTSKYYLSCKRRG